ncbi:Non-specific lipid-transfer protein-like protein, partial [Thalictrum thalictroides]
MGCSKAVLVVGTILVVLISTTSSSATQPPAASAAPAFAPNEDASPVAPAPSDDCFNSLLNVSDCLTFVEAESNLTTPDKGCCPSLAGLVESNPICLCKLLGSNATSFGVSIDVNKALQLPKACRVSTPPVSLCSAAGVPVGVPTTSEGPGLSPAGGMAPDMSMTPKNGAPSSRGFTKVIFVGLSSAAAMAMAMAM